MGCDIWEKGGACLEREQIEFSDGSSHYKSTSVEQHIPMGTTLFNLFY